MKKFTFVQVKEVPNYYSSDDTDTDNDLVKLSENLEEIEPIKAFFITGHLFTNEVVTLPEIEDIVEKTYVNRKYLVEVDMLMYHDGNENPHDENELAFVGDNFSNLCEDEKVELINADYFTLDVNDM